MHLPLVNSSGQSVGTIEVNDGLFDAPMNQALVHQVAVAHRANARQGTAATKTRGKVSGGGAKPWRQKHTGRARQGSRRAPQWRGGGVVFGPQPRDYSQRIPKKMNRGAIRCLLSQKVRDEKLTVLDGLEFEQPKTKEMAAVLSNLGISSPVLVVTPTPQADIILSARNLPRVTTMPVSQLSPLDLLNHDRAVVTLEAIRRAEELWAADVVKADDGLPEESLDELPEESVEEAPAEVSEENQEEA